MAEGTDPEGLFDLSGLGFSSDQKKIVRQVAPTVSIKVNGNAVELPATPVRSTNANGIAGYNLYEATYNLPSGTAATPIVSASASDPTVKVAVTQAESKTGAAAVQFDYNGIVKTYKIVFASE